jgi:hypothetical protein
MTLPAYPAARAVASTVHDYFARHHDAARDDGDANVAALPSPDTIEALIDAAFWASLRREEGYIPKISLAYLPPEQSTLPMLFRRGLTLAAGALARLAPAVERPGVHLGVWHDGDGLFGWGTTRALPAVCFVVEVVAPGLVVVKHPRREESGKYINVAVLEGDQIKVLDQRMSSLPDYPALVTSLLGFDPFVSGAGSVNVLVRLAVSMRAHRRGGSLLVVPAATDPWRESIVHPIPYSVAPPYSELADLVRDDPVEKRPRRWQEALGDAVEAIAGLTAIDGATVITDRYELLAFGAKIARREGFAQVVKISVREPIEGGDASIVDPAELGGTRHLSAAQFVQDQQDAVALVASQDGRFTAFAWSPRDAIVHAYRVETLLL